MASWREIDRIRKDAESFRALAARMLTHRADALSEWETSFLESITRSSTAEYTTRQSEKLLEIRDSTEFVTTVRGFSVQSLLRDCKAAHLDLPEDDGEFLNRVKIADDGSVRLRAAYRLMRCARQLNIIEEDVDA